MAASNNSLPIQHRRDLSGQTVVVIGGSSGIGLETARLARARGADIILTARNTDRLHRAGLELGASIAAFDATDFDRLARFFDELPGPIDHVLVTGPGPYYAPLAEFDLELARRDGDRAWLLGRDGALTTGNPGDLARDGRLNAVFGCEITSSSDPAAAALLAAGLVLARRDVG